MDERNNKMYKMTRTSELFVWQNPSAAADSRYSAFDDNGSDE